MAQAPPNRSFTMPLQAPRTPLAAAWLTPLVAAVPLALLITPPARADAITEWNAKTGEILHESRMGTPPAMRTVAIVQTAAYEALQAVRAQPGAADAAVAAAHRTALAALVPQQRAAIDAAAQAALSRIAEGPAKAAGIAAGEQAAATVLAARKDDGAATPETYRPHAAPGAWVPTAVAAVPQWAQRRPWLMASPSQFRPAPPPALTSDTWARDYNEVKLVGARASTQRTPAQTDAARFWEYTGPAIYLGALRSVAEQPGRDLMRNARLYAAVAQAMDDAIIAVWDAKYHYGYWRPVTAIRNGDTDGHDATVRDAGWNALLESPLHPEYPSGHGILAGAMVGVLQAEFGGRAPQAPIATASPSVQGAVRRWGSLDEFLREVGDARVWAGIHYRTSVETASEMGRRIGQLAAARWLQADL